MSSNQIPNFKRFFAESTIFTTHTSEEHLEPWVQWPTVHCGVPFAKHGVAHMGDGADLRYKGVAEILSDAGVPCGVFGSMNLNYGRLHGYMIPDPWARGGSTHPPELTAFYDVVAQAVKDSSRYALNLKQLSTLGVFLARNGLSTDTVLRAVHQLASERSDRGLRWRRAMLLDWVSYDVFRSLNKKKSVKFATFFSNSTAHFQHYYWREMDPSAFNGKRMASHPSLRSAILDGYRSMDVLLAKFMRDYPSATLMLCTALSQGPREVADVYYFRAKDPDALLAFAGLPASDYWIMPAMSAEFHVHSRTSIDAEKAARVFSGSTIDGSPAFHVALEGRKVVVSPRGSSDLQTLDKELCHPNKSRRRFGDLFHTLEGSASGVHRRDGALWIRNGRHRIVPTTIELTDIAPTILALFNVAQPDYMEGRSLLHFTRLADPAIHADTREVATAG